LFSRWASEGGENLRKHSVQRECLDAKEVFCQKRRKLAEGRRELKQGGVLPITYWRKKGGVSSVILRDALAKTGKESSREKN